MNLLSGIFALLGLAFHVRVYKIVGEPVVTGMLESYDRDNASFVDFLLMLATPWVPMLFYATCFAFCFVRVRNIFTIITGVLVLVISIPYFASLYHISETSRVICLFAGGSAIYNHMMTFPAKPDGFLEGPAAG